MPRVLLSTVCRPVGLPGDGPSMGVDVMKGQLCVNQGVFRTSGAGIGYGLEYIAQNIDSPAVVLHWPSARELARELERGRYDIVGLSFPFQLLPRMAETAALVRAHAPRARLVLGGHGTVAPEAALHGDLVCRGDGIAFLRDLLGEQQGQPIRHPHIVYGNRLLSLPVRAGRKAVICTGLGCAEGCDFCATSHFFNQRYQPFVDSGQQLFSIMKAISDRGAVDEFMILDENFLVRGQRAAELADACQAHGRFFEFFTFSSVKALSRYSAEELCRIGVSAVWVGFEAKRAGYDKLHGEELGRLTARLRRVGILVCGSMIIGFDYQSPSIIRAELAEFLAAKPTYLQCLIYGPTPGTPLYDRLEREHRWISGPPGLGGVPYGQADGYRLGFRHPHISPERMSALQRECLDQDLRQGGFSVVRAIETWAEGYETLREAREPFLRARAEIYRRKLIACRPLLPVCAENAPGPGPAQRTRALHQDLVRAFGPPDRREQALARLVLPAAARFTALCQQVDIFQEPWLRRRTYRC